jgi:hypothetical protein
MKNNWPISIDTAVEILGYFFAQKSNLMDEAIDPAQKESLKEQIKMLHFEMQVIYGLKGNEEVRKSIFDKVLNLYSPQMKYEISRSC